MAVCRRVLTQIVTILQIQDPEQSDRIHNCRCPEILAVMGADEMAQQQVFWVGCVIPEGVSVKSRDTCKSMKGEFQTLQVL